MVETSSLNNAFAMSSKSNDSNNKRARVGTGKLSSRNTRRKRRDHNKLSTKKLKPPIPSFSCSPIVEEDEIVENEASTSLDSPSQRVANEAKGPNTIAPTADETITKQPEINKRVPHESIIVDTAGSSKLPRPIAANEYLLQKDNVRSVSTSSADDVNGSTTDHNSKPINTAQKAVNDAPTSNDATGETLHKLSKQTNKSSPFASAPLAPTSTRKSKEQPSKNKKDVCSNNKASKKVYDMVEVAKPEKQRSTRYNTTETIEILDDDDDDEREQPGKDLTNNSTTSSSAKIPIIHANSVNIGAAEKIVPEKTERQSKKRKQPDTDPISVDSPSNEEGVIAPKKTKTIAQKKTPARRKPAATKSKSVINNTRDESANGTQKQTRKKQCTACASCKCQSRDGSATSPQKLSSLSLSGSDARVEQTLKNRMLKIERNIAWTESQRHECARELKRHRGTLQKKLAKTGTNRDKRQNFLADAQVTEEMAQTFATASLDRKEVKKIQTRVFGKKRSSKNEPQPTLTQMFGGDTERDDDRLDDNLSANEEDDQSRSRVISSAEESSRADPHDSLSFWNDESIHATDQFIGSMTQFYEATTRFKDKQVHSTAAWAKATAKVIRNEAASQSHEEEEGIDALVELFDLSPKKKPASISSHDEECNDTFLKSQLSQSGSRAAQGITNEIAKDEAKRIAIERACPNWKENVEYSFKRKDPEGLENALNHVKKERQRLEDARDRILQAFLERSSTLEVYEKAIEGSLKRLAEKENEHEHHPLPS